VPAAPTRKPPGAGFVFSCLKTRALSIRADGTCELFLNPGNEGYLHQSRTFDKDHRHGFLLVRDKGDNDSPAYRAGFRVSPNGQWLGRMQKLDTVFYTSAMTIDFHPQSHWADNNAEVIKTAAAVAEQPKRTLPIWGD
jgi:hypothetical protein